MIFSEFSSTHVKNGHAIVDMALENYVEMRDHVNNADYKNRRKLELKLERMFPEEFIAANPSVVATRQNQLAQADPALFANAALGLTSLDNRPKLGGISNPTLIVVGLADETTPPALSYDLHAGIDGSELIELPGVGHCPQLQNPRAFLDAVVPFLRS